jgi:hypothetical protein
LEAMVDHTNEFKFPVRAFHHAHQTYLVPEVRTCYIKRLLLLIAIRSSRKPGADVLLHLLSSLIICSTRPKHTLAQSMLERSSTKIT